MKYNEKLDKINIISVEAKKNPEEMIAEIKDMLSKGVVPTMLKDNLILRGDNPKILEEAVKKLPPICKTPFTSLNSKMGGGLEVGGIHIFTAETGIGKSTCSGEIIFKFFQDGCAVSIFAFEDTISRTSKRFMGIGASKNFMRNPHISEDELTEAYNNIINSDRIYLIDDYGAFDSVIPYHLKIESVAVQMKNEHPDKPRWILLDHITMLVAHSEISDERQAIDNTMHQLMRIAKRHDVGFLVISHLSRSNTSHVDIINRLRGSGGLGHMADSVISVDRLSNKLRKNDSNYVETEEDRNSLVMYVSKNRRNGVSGEIEGVIIYDHETGRLLEAGEFEIIEDGYILGDFINESEDL